MMAANTGAIYQPVGSTPPATLASWSLKTATQQGHPLPIHELSSAVLDHGPGPRRCTPSGRLATLRIGCGNRTATPDGVLNPDGVIPSAGNRAASIGAPPFGWSTTQAVVCRKVAMSTQRGDQRAALLCLSNSSKRAGAAGHLRRTMAHVVLALASSRSRYRSCATVARSGISHLAVAADVV